MDFQDYQRAFAAHIRDPKASARPKEVPARRMRVYNELLYNNVEGFLLACFPVCRQVLGSRKWARLVRAFFRDHACHTPYFRQIPEEFLRYLQEEWTRSEDYPDFLPELAHYEEVELDLETSSRDAHLPPHDPAGDLLAGRPLLNPVMRLLAYRYPVQRISSRYKPDTPPAEATFIAAYRDAAFQVRFLAINAVTARLLSQLVEDDTLSGRQALARLAEVLPQLDVTALQGFGKDLLDSLRREGVVLGALHQP
jgi:hypothetical protein